MIYFDCAMVPTKWTSKFFIICNRLETGLNLKNNPNNVPIKEDAYHQTSNIDRTKSQNLNVSRFVL